MEVFAVALLTIVTFAFPAVGQEAGRYQLFMGAYPFVNLQGQEFWERDLFRIDTVTGKVWVGRSTQFQRRDGKYVQLRGWVEFEHEIPIAPPRE